MESIAARRQDYCNQAYYTVLRCLYMNDKASKGVKYLTLMGKLRKELNISMEQAKTWSEELTRAKAQGHTSELANQPSLATSASIPAAIPATANAQPGKSKGASTSALAKHGRAQKRKAPEPDEPVQTSPVVVGRKVRHYWVTNNIWKDGVIINHNKANNKVCIGYDLGTERQSQEWVLFERSPHLQVLDDCVDLSRYNLPRS